MMDSVVKRLRDGRTAVIARRMRAWQVAVDGKQVIVDGHLRPAPAGQGCTHVIASDHTAIGLTGDEAAACQALLDTEIDARRRAWLSTPAGRRYTDRT